MVGNKLSPSTTTHLWNSALKLEGVVGPMFENGNLQMGQVKFPLESLDLRPKKILFFSD
jgi:hypothetical protein